MGFKKGFSFTGTLELRKAISQWHQNEGLSIDPQQIVVGTGSKELIFLVMNIFHGGKLMYSVSKYCKKYIYPDMKMKY